MWQARDVLAKSGPFSSEWDSRYTRYRGRPVDVCSLFSDKVCISGNWFHWWSFLEAPQFWNKGKTCLHLFFWQTSKTTTQDTLLYVVGYASATVLLVSHARGTDVSVGLCECANPQLAACYITTVFYLQAILYLNKRLIVRVRVTTCPPPPFLSPSSLLPPSPAPQWCGPLPQGQLWIKILSLMHPSALSLPPTQTDIHRKTDAFWCVYINLCVCVFVWVCVWFDSISFDSDSDGAAEQLCSRSEESQINTIKALHTEPTRPAVV